MPIPGESAQRERGNYVPTTGAGRKEVQRKRKHPVHPQMVIILSEGRVTKGANCRDLRLGSDCSPQPGNTRGLGPVTPASPGELTRRPLTPPPRKFSCSEPQSKTKGRGEEGATVPSDQPLAPEPRAPSPEPGARARAGAPARLLARLSAGRRLRPGQPVVPCLPAAARDRSRGSSRGAARDGKTRWLHPSSLLLHPSLPVPAGLAALRRGPGRPRARLVRAHPRERVAFV